jgi:hypothetical protein
MNTPRERTTIELITAPTVDEVVAQLQEEIAASDRAENSMEQSVSDLLRNIRLREAMKLITSASASHLKVVAQ